MKIRQEIVFLSTFMLIAFLGCSKGANQEELEVAEEAIEIIDDEHNALNSLDYMGIYHGMLPCADCEGIDTTIELESGNSYVIKIIYLGKGDQKTFENNGIYSWNKQGNTITLEEEIEPSQYFDFVGENILFKLDLYGHKISGDLADKYVLHKK